MRFLHARLRDADHRSVAGEPVADRDRGPRDALRQPVPVHRLRDDHQRRVGRRGGEAMTDTAIPAQRYVGASVKRSEDPRILTGRGRYIDDVQLPGMLYATFVRSTMAHANITGVDVA